jgi:hypothetical protein
MRLSTEQRNALLRLNHAVRITEGIHETLMRNIDEWDNAMYLAVCVRLAEITQAWLCNVGASDEFKQWLAEYVTADIGGQNMSDLEKQLDANGRCVQLLIAANKEESARRKKQEAEDALEDAQRALEEAQ